MPARRRARAFAHERTERDEKMLARDGSRRLKKFAEDNERKEFRQITQGVWYVRGMGHSNAAFCRGQDGRDPHRHAGYIRAGGKNWQSSFEGQRERK